MTDEVTGGKGSRMHLFDLSTGRRKCKSSSGVSPGQVSLSVSLVVYSSLSSLLVIFYISLFSLLSFISN